MAESIDRAGNPQEHHRNSVRKSVGSPHIKRIYITHAVYEHLFRFHRNRRKDFYRMVEDIRNKIAERVTALIPKAGSVANFASSVGVTPRSVAYWVKGERIPSAEAFINMHCVYGEPLDYLMGVSENRTPVTQKRPSIFQRLFG